MTTYLNAHSERENGIYRESWDQARLIAYYSIAPNLKDNNSNPHKFMPFPWDKGGGDQEDEMMSVEELKEYEKAWAVNSDLHLR